MFLLFLFSISSHTITCNHDDLQSRLHPTVSTSARRILSWRDPSTGSPMRVHFDLSYIEAPDDSLTCREVGQLVSWHGQTFACVEADLFSEAQQQAVIGTIGNLKSFISSLLSVIPVEELTSEPAFSLYSDDSYGYPVSQSRSDGHTDYYMTVYPRPFGANSLTLANAAFVSTAEWDSGRPIQGIMNINMAQVPSSPQSVDSLDRQFFETAVHEMFHALGISSSAFSSWLDPNTHSPYSASLPLYEMTDSSTGKQFRILHTPRLHSLISERFGFAFFGGDTARPVGVELENNGAQGTAGSHWEGRTYFTELMQGTTYGVGRISAVSLAALADTGWYGVSADLAEPLAWGDFRSIGGADASGFADFLVGPPPLAWPPHYLAQGADELNRKRCAFDHLSTGVFGASVRDCGDKSDGECEYPAFYDPLNTGYFGSSGVDYVVLAVPGSERCRNPGTADGYAVELGEVYGPQSMCALSTLFLGGRQSWSAFQGACYQMECHAGELTLFVGAGGAAVRCSAAGERVSVEGYGGEIECPNPAVICGMIAYLANSSGSAQASRTASLARTPSRSPGPSRSSQPEIVITVGGLVAVNSTEILVRFRGGGEIEPPDNGTDIRLREVIIDGASIIASGLEIRERIELVGPAVLAPAFGEIVELADGIDVIVVADKSAVPRLEIGNVGGRYSVVPSGVQIDVEELESGVVGVVGKAIIVAETLNCEAWKAKATLSDGEERFELECVANGTVVSLVLREVPGRSRSRLPEATVEIEKSRSQTPQPEEEPKLLLGLTEKELIIVGVVIAVVIVFIAVVVRCCRKKKKKNDESEREVEFLRKARRGDDIYT